MNKTFFGDGVRRVGRQLVSLQLTFALAALLVPARAGAAPPRNDNFANATILTASTITNVIKGSNVDATSEAGEPATVGWPPNSPSPLGGKSVWWRFKPDVAADVTISTAGSDFDTQLGVFVGSSVSNLTEVASNEDEAGATDGHSAVAFGVVKGVTYYVMVDGYGGAQGAIKLSITGLTQVGDVTPVIVAITSPLPGSSTSNATITVSGTARSASVNDPVAQVLVGVNSAEAVTADGTTNWQTTVTLTPGVNVIHARSVTQNGGESAEATRTVNFITLSPLTLQTNGSGRIIPNLNGRNVPVGSTVRLQAIPATDFVFSGWSGATNSTNAFLEFVMQEDAVLAANFVPDIFASIRGTYQGLIIDSNAPAPQSSGFFTVNVPARNQFIGTFIIGGKTFKKSGAFDAAGQATFSLVRSNGLTGTLTLDTNNLGVITGTLSDGVFNSTLLGYRDVFDGVTNVAPFAGRYNMNIQPAAPVEGNGFANLTVDGSGVLRMAGQLADGRPITQTANISQNGNWPLYVSLYGGKGAIIGWLTFSNLPASSLSGDVIWFRPTLGGQLFPDGFTNTFPTIGSLFITPPPGVPMLNWSNGVAVLSGDDLPVPFTNSVTFRSNNTVAVNFQMNGFTVSVNSQGLVRGRFVNPVTQRNDPIAGAVLPKTNWAGGFFLETNNSGLFLMGQTPITDTNAPATTPPATLEGASLNLTPARSAGTIVGVPADFTFGATNFTTGSTNFNGAYNFSSAPAAGVNVTELNLFGGIIRRRTVVLRLLLNFTSDTSGTYLASITAGGSGTSSGTFNINLPTPPPPPTDQPAP